MRENSVALCVRSCAHYYLFLLLFEHIYTHDLLAWDSLWNRRGGYRDRRNTYIKLLGQWWHVVRVHHVILHELNKNERRIERKKKKKIA